MSAGNGNVVLWWIHILEHEQTSSSSGHYIISAVWNIYNDNFSCRFGYFFATLCNLLCYLDSLEYMKNRYVFIRTRIFCICVLRVQISLDTCLVTRRPEYMQSWGLLRKVDGACNCRKCVNQGLCWNDCNINGNMGVLISIIEIVSLIPWSLKRVCTMCTVSQCFVQLLRNKYQEGIISPRKGVYLLPYLNELIIHLSI